MVPKVRFSGGVKSRKEPERDGGWNSTRVAAGKVWVMRAVGADNQGNSPVNSGFIHFMSTYRGTV